MVKIIGRRFYAAMLSTLLLVSSITGCTQQGSGKTAESNADIIASDNELKKENSKALNKVEHSDNESEIANVESLYDYAKEIQFWTPDQKLEITSKSQLDQVKLGDKVPAVQFFLDENFSIEIETKYDNETLDDSSYKYTVYPNSEGVYSIGTLFYYEQDQSGEVKQSVKESIRMRGGSVGWTSGDIIYMVQNVDFETGEKLSKPLVTTIVMDREERQALTPEYYVNENGEFYAQWDPVEGADAYAIISYYRMPDKDILNEIIAENNENAKKHEKEASADDPLVINELKIGEEGEGDSVDNILYVDHSITSVVDVITDTKYSMSDANFRDERIQKAAEAGYVTFTPNDISTALIPGSNRYLSVIALKQGSGVDESESAHNNEVQDEAILKSIKELDNLAEYKEPGYYAIEESPLYDFNALAQNIPSYIKKYESNYPSTTSFIVDKAEDITNFIYVRMTDGSIRKHNLEYMNEYILDEMDVDTDENKEDIQQVLSVNVRVKNSPFYFKYSIKEFDKNDPEKSIEVIKSTFDKSIKFKADMEDYPSKAAVVIIDKEKKTVSFKSDSEKKFYDNSYTNGSSSSKKKGKSKISLAISPSEIDGGISAYNDFERIDCLPEKVIASTTMSQEIAWAMITGKKEFVLNYNTNRSAIEDAIQEVCWQNQYILELDYPEKTITMQSYGSYLVEVDYFVSDINQRKEMQKAIKSKAKSILGSLEGKYSSSLELLYQINHYICDTVAYDDSVIENRISKTTSRTAYGPLLEGKGVCSAYSRAFQLLMTMSDMTCFVDGGAVPEGKHAWNIVKTQDGYYMVDSTWNDGGENIYLMVPEDIYSADHRSEGICIKEPETLKNITYAKIGGSYDYLAYIGKAVTLADLDDALFAYGSYGYCPNWLRVYDFNDDINQYLTSAGQSLAKKYGGSYYYKAEWFAKDPGIVYFTSQNLTMTKESYGQQIKSN